MEHLDFPIFFAPLVTGLGLLGTFWGITWKMGQDTDKKVGRIYQRFDEFKDHLEETHTRREVCEIQHKQLKEDLNEIKSDVKAILKRIKFNGDNN